MPRSVLSGYEKSGLIALYKIVNTYSPKSLSIGQRRGTAGLSGKKD